MADVQGAMRGSPAALLVTMGDAAGIGPEIIVRAHARGACAGAVVVGCPRVLRRAGAAQVVRVEQPAQALGLPPEALAVVVPPTLPSDLDTLPLGCVDARCGAAAALCIRHAVHLLRQAQGRGLVTAPLHKEALAAAGEHHPGHTELLQELAAAWPGVAGATATSSTLPPVRMMLTNGELAVVLVTIHMALRKAIDALSVPLILETLHLAHQHAVPGLGRAPRLAVAGLNPHAGEGGLFGDEEQRLIAPAIALARQAGLDVSGPYAPDTVFMRARRGAFDVVVAMVHDHGLIPVKYLGVEHGVNVTLGLPFVRTSPDHGTAFDIAGQGVADPSSLMAALAWARRAVG